MRNTWLGQPVARQAEGDQSVVMRPDRAVVIGHGIVARLGGGHGADAPAREEVAVHQLVGDAGGAVGSGDAGQQHMPGVRGADTAGLLGAVQGESVGAEIIAPECGLEALAKLVGSLVERVGQVRRNRARAQAARPGARAA